MELPKNMSSTPPAKEAPAIPVKSDHSGNPIPVSDEHLTEEKPMKWNKNWIKLL